MDSKIKVHGRAQSRTVLGIVEAYLLLHPESTKEDLDKAFPETLSSAAGKSLFLDVREKGNVKNYEKRYFERDDETIFLADGTELAMIEAYKSASGVDLSKYIGMVNVSVEYTAYDFNQEVLLETETITGKTIIALSEASTAEAPALKMLANPMGIEDKLYATLRALTIENTNYWCDGEYYPDNVNLMQTISWNADSQETFTASLDNIIFDVDRTIEFTGFGVDQYGDQIEIVPFAYEFSAYDRELAAIADGSFVKEDEYAYDCTANPAYHLNNTDISEDAFEADNYAESSAVILENGNIVFTFCMANALDSDYTKVVATYTPNN